MELIGSKVKSSVNADGSHYAWMIRCPGCNDIHVLTNWNWNGSYERPTFQPSLLVQYFDSDGRTERARCHSFVTEGRIQYLDDCSHALRGQTVDLPDWDAALEET